MGIVSKRNRVAGIPVIIQVRFCNDLDLSPTVIIEIVSKTNRSAGISVIVKVTYHNDHPSHAFS